MSEPVFILATDLRPGEADWDSLVALATGLQDATARPLGIKPVVDLACLPTRSGEGPADLLLGEVIDAHAGNGASELFVLPATFELNAWQRTALGEQLIEARRRHRAASIHHDSVDPTYPLLVDCFAGLVLNSVRSLGLTPGQVGLLLVASGQGDASARADSYRLMRLLWERTEADRAEVGFVHHAQPALRTALERCLAEPLNWLLLPQCQWDGALCDDADALLADYQRSHSEAAGWRLLDPPRHHPAIVGWLEQRMFRLWQDKRARQATRIPSLRSTTPQPLIAELWTGQDWVPASESSSQTQSGILARVRDSKTLADILARVLPRAKRYLVKVTWHGYATGTYTDASALDRLLSALPGRAVLLEGHTSGRNLGGADWDWETESQQHRTWIRQQDLEFLRRTGLADVIAKHQAQYVNVTEAWWDGGCAPVADVQAALGDVTLRFPELAEFVPAVLMDLRGAPLISFARFKGPTRLGISNLFGLIPHPLRTEWHGPDIPYFAGVCCDVARLYGSLFPLFGLVEAFDSAVRWNRKGLYRSRWGNYDLVLTDGICTMSQGLVGADLLASRLQGQDVSRSAFFDVVRNQLEWPASAATLSLPMEIQTQLN